jgi:glycosyltransferase 2 family protein
VNKALLWTLAKYLLAIAVLSYVLHANWDQGLGDVWQRHVVEREPIDGAYLLAGILLLGASMAATILRWYLLVRAQEIDFTLLAAVRLGTLGYLFNAFLPGSVGGDVIKAGALARSQSRQTIAVATVVMDRAMSIWAMISLLAVAGSVAWSFGLIEASALVPAEATIIASLVIVALGIAGWIFMGVCTPEFTARFEERLTRVPKIGGSLAQLWQAVWLYRSRPATIAWALVLSTISNVFDILSFAAFAHALWDGQSSNPLPTLTAHFLLVPIGLVISGIPLFPGGAGVGEAGFGGLYALFGSSAANGVLGSLLFRVTGWLIGILGYLGCLACERGE